MICTRDELVQILSTSPVPETLAELREHGGSAEDLAYAIFEAAEKVLFWGECP
jgi:hypothetical protein